MRVGTADFTTNGRSDKQSEVRRAGATRPRDALFRGLFRFVVVSWCEWRRRELHRTDFAAAYSTAELLVVLRALVGIADSEGDHGFIELVIIAQISRDRAGIARPGMTFGEQFAADPRVLVQTLAFQILAFDGGFVIAKLTNQVVATGDGSPSQENVGLHLHRALSFGGAASLMPLRGLH